MVSLLVTKFGLGYALRGIFRKVMTVTFVR
jgi:hypothetical protein